MFGEYLAFLGISDWNLSSFGRRFLVILYPNINLFFRETFQHFLSVRKIIVLLSMRQSEKFIDVTGHLASPSLVTYKLFLYKSSFMFFFAINRKFIWRNLIRTNRSIKEFDWFVLHWPNQSFMKNWNFFWKSTEWIVSLFFQSSSWIFIWLFFRFDILLE